MRKMWGLNKWIFFHCIKKNRITPYECKEIPDILKIPIPNIESNEHIIVLCKYTPIFMQKFFINKKLRNMIHIDIVV